MEALRNEASVYAKKILEKEVEINVNDLDSKHNILKRFKRSKHVLLKQSEIDHCVNNDLDFMYLYDELLSKYNGNIGGDKKEYYQPNGNKRGRPKKDKNE